jgi:hypothetical protein
LKNKTARRCGIVRAIGAFAAGCSWDESPTMLPIRSALGLATAVMFLNMALASVASAQDVMQLDLMFRDSLLRKTAPESQLDDHTRRQDTGAMQDPVRLARRHPRPRRHR